MSQLELNKGDNFIFLVDVSASMNATDCPGGAKRIEYLKEQVITFANEASKYDDDGVDIVKFGHAVTVVGKATGGNAKDLIGALAANESMTDTAGAIQKAYDLHRAGKYAQTVCFVATDGEPADRNKVKGVIRNIASEIKDEHEFAISILTVGNIDAGLQSFLTELDDDLKAQHDIVDVKALTDVDFLSAFAGALHD